jgi:uncharacterized membrane protein
VSETHPAVARYLARLREELAGIADRERADIVREIEDHVADAAAAGRSIDEVFASLGPADALARAYAVELALNPARPVPGRIDRVLTVIGLLTVASLPSFVIAVVLGAVGVALTAAGVGVLGAGIVALVRPELVPDLTVSPWVCFVAGPSLMALGLAALAGLYLYARFLVRVTVQTLRRVRRHS